jgi:hypothetical protein
MNSGPLARTVLGAGAVVLPALAAVVESLQPGSAGGR